MRIASVSTRALQHRRRRNHRFCRALSRAREPSPLSRHPAEIRTALSYATDLRLFADWCRDYGLSLFDVQRSHLELFGRSMEARGLMASTVARRLSALASFYRYCEQEGHVDRSPPGQQGGNHVIGEQVDRSNGVIGLHMHLTADTITIGTVRVVKNPERASRHDRGGGPPPNFYDARVNLIRAVVEDRSTWPGWATAMIRAARFHRWAEVVPVAFVGLPGMKPDPDDDRRRCRPSFCSDPVSDLNCGSHRVRHTRERDGKRIAGRGEDIPMMRSNCGTDKLLVTSHRR